MAPMAPRKPCIEPLCRGFAVPGRARCQEHQRQVWRADNQTERVRGHNSQVHQALRRQVLAEEERCANPHCTTPYDNPTLDYRVPLSLGGRQERENAQRLCLSCNSARGAKSWEAFLAWSAEKARLRGEPPA